MTKISRRFAFDAGHRVLGHEGKCAFLHGHRYTAEVFVNAPKLDDVGRVIDFSVLKSKIGKWIDDNWDHQLILSVDDPLIPTLTSAGQKVYVLDPGNPTAEVIAKELLFVSERLLASEAALRVEKVVIWETPNCSASACSHDVHFDLKQKYGAVTGPKITVEDMRNDDQ